jgi:hypothetical protein
LPINSLPQIAGASARSPSPAALSMPRLPDACRLAPVTHTAIISTTYMNSRDHYALTHDYVAARWPAPVRLPLPGCASAVSASLLTAHPSIVNCSYSTDIHVLLTCTAVYGNIDQSVRWEAIITGSAATECPSAGFYRVTNSHKYILHHYHIAICLPGKHWSRCNGDSKRVRYSFQNIW